MARPHTLLTHVVADDRGLAMAPSDCPQYAVAIPASLAPPSQGTPTARGRACSQSPRRAASYRLRLGPWYRGLGPGQMSAARPVPSTVPSDIQSSYPKSGVEDSKKQRGADSEERSPVRAVEDARSPDLPESLRPLLGSIGPPNPLPSPGEEVGQRLVDDRHLLGE
jgi:hypothetical protein